MRILAVDVGGTHVKVLATGKNVARKIDSGPTMTARQMVREVKRATADWVYDAVSIGYPGPVLHDRPVAEPRNLGAGWVGFDYRKTFGKPVKMVNDAAMQALGSYEGGRMLFLGLGTASGRRSWPTAERFGRIRTGFAASQLPSPTPLCLHRGPKGRNHTRRLRGRSKRAPTLCLRGCTRPPSGRSPRVGLRT